MAKKKNWIQKAAPKGGSAGESLAEEKADAPGKMAPKKKRLRDTYKKKD